MTDHAAGLPGVLQSGLSWLYHHLTVCRPPQDRADESLAVDPVADWCRTNFQALEGGVQEFTVVMLGQTGAGKTSFLDLMFNFPAVLRCGDDSCPRDFHHLEYEQNRANCMESRTNASTVYKLALGPLRLRIVDTPGLGDTDGPDADEEHCRGIVDCVQELGVVHAIVLVINGRVTRMTAQLRYALTRVCSLLPKTADQNILVVFTNCESEICCNFGKAHLNEVLFHDVGDERKMYIDNPYSLWRNARSDQEEVVGPHVQQELVKGCRDAAADMGRFFIQVSAMPPMGTTVFKERYELKKDIERNTVECLQEHRHMQLKRSQLDEITVAIREASTEEALHREYTKDFHGMRWEFGDAALKRGTPRHSTLCASPGCHSNCHAPCYLKMTTDREDFKNCVAIKRSRVKDECSECGHSYTFHYHQMKCWKEVAFTQPLIDEAMRAMHGRAADIVSQKVAAKRVIDAEISKCKERQHELGASLVRKIREFEETGLLKDYAVLLRNQRDLVQEYLDHGRIAGGDVQALQTAVGELNEHLEIVKSNLKGVPVNKVDWAYVTLEVESDAVLGDIDWAYRRLSNRIESELGKTQLNEAFGILRKHLRFAQMR